MNILEGLYVLGFYACLVKAPLVIRRVFVGKFYDLLQIRKLPFFKLLAGQGLKLFVPEFIIDISAHFDYSLISLEILIDELPFFIAGSCDDFYVCVCQVLEAALTFEISRNVRKLLRALVQRKFAVLVFGEVPKTAVNDLLGDFYGFVCFYTPAGGTGRKNVNVLCAPDILCLFYLFFRQKAGDEPEE